MAKNKRGRVKGVKKVAVPEFQRFSGIPKEDQAGVQAQAAKQIPSLEIVDALRKNLEAIAPLALDVRSPLPDVSPGDLCAILSRRMTMGAQVHKVEGFVLGYADHARKAGSITDKQAEDINTMVRNVIHGKP